MGFTFVPKLQLKQMMVVFFVLLLFRSAVSAPLQVFRVCSGLNGCKTARANKNERRIKQKRGRKIRGF